jgi:hypothetical protein
MSRVSCTSSHDICSGIVAHLQMRHGIRTALLLVTGASNADELRAHPPSRLPQRNPEVTLPRERLRFACRLQSLSERRRFWGKRGEVGRAMRYSLDGGGPVRAGCAPPRPGVLPWQRSDLRRFVHWLWKRPADKCRCKQYAKDEQRQYQFRYVSYIALWYCICWTWSWS